jgi:cob(I)alamin adenosyltransferase
MKIYTKMGDKGHTQLLGRSDVPKSDPRVFAYGAVDELNAQIGVVIAHLKNSSLKTKPMAFLNEELSRIQGELFVMGGLLSADPQGFDLSTLPQLKEDYILRLERVIDSIASELSPLKNFILPGGSVLGAELHLSRTTCRRVEREIVDLHEKTRIEPLWLTYINRLSDVFFMMARYVNHHQGHQDTPWLSENYR